MMAHRRGGTAIHLSGGPYHAHVFVGDRRLPEARFPTEPGQDIHGRPSICAPWSTDDGPVVYVNTGKTNMVGMPVFQIEGQS